MNNIYDMDGFKAACNSLKATRLELILAKIFGTKSVGTDDDCTVTIYHYKGKSYLTDFKMDSKK